MNTDDLDTRIRALVCTAVADAPDAPTLSSTSGTMASVVPLRRTSRSGRWWWAGVAAGAAAAAVVAAVVWVGDEGERTISPATIEATTTAPAPGTTVPPSPDGYSVLTAGPDGVQWITATGTVVWTDEPMAAAVKAPDGSLIVQRKSGYPGSVPHEMADTLPLRITGPGVAPQSLFGEAADPVAGWYTVHDAATVNGRPLLLVERQGNQASGTESPAGVLFTFDLVTGAVVTVVDQFAGWEQGSSRLHLAETGLVVGEFFDSATGSFVAVNVLGDVGVPTAADFGLEPYYNDCADCPRRFTVSRDGSTLAWLDGTMLRVATPGGDQEWFDLGDAAVGVADLDLGQGYVVLTYGFAWQDDPPPPVVVIINTGEHVALPGRTSTVATP